MKECVLTVRFWGMQGTDELYRCSENKKTYIRRKYEDPYVEWLTTSKWTGGYEPDTHVRPGVSFRLVDRNGNEIFTEKIERISGYWYPYAEKKGPFYSDCPLDLSEKVKGKYCLRTYEEWKSWLVGYARVYLKTPQRCPILPERRICRVAFACIPQRSAALMRLASALFWRIVQHF